MVVAHPRKCRRVRHQPLGHQEPHRQWLGMDRNSVPTVSWFCAVHHELSGILGGFLRRQAFCSQRRILGNCAGACASEFSQLVPGPLSVCFCQISLCVRFRWRCFMKAIWEDAILAESERTVVIEGNHYFPPDSVKREFLQLSDKHTTCHWKG